jgi:hypothetical protein
MIPQVNNLDVMRSNKSQLKLVAETFNLPYYSHILFQSDTPSSFLGFKRYEGNVYVTDFAKAYKEGGVFVIFRHYYSEIEDMPISEGILATINSAVRREPIDFVGELVEPNASFFLFIV